MLGLKRHSDFYFAISQSQRQTERHSDSPDSGLDVEGEWVRGGEGVLKATEYSARP